MHSTWAPAASFREAVAARGERWACQAGMLGRLLAALMRLETRSLRRPLPSIVHQTDAPQQLLAARMLVPCLCLVRLVLPGVQAAQPHDLPHAVAALLHRGRLFHGLGHFVHLVHLVATARPVAPVAAPAVHWGSCFAAVVVVASLSRRRPPRLLEVGLPVLSTWRYPVAVVEWKK
jgi:hypothetical protein